MRYILLMDTDAPQPAPPKWVEALERSDADVAAGRIVSWHEARERLVEKQAELEAEQVTHRA